MAEREPTKSKGTRKLKSVGGRVARSGSETRERSLTVGFRAKVSERAEIAAAAARAGLSVGAYVRSRVLAAPKTRAVRQPHVDRVLLAQVLGQLGKVGSNVHQITKRLNFADWLAAEDVPETLAEVRAVAVEIMKALGRQPERVARRVVPERPRP